MVILASKEYIFMLFFLILGLGPQPPMQMREESREGQQFSNRDSPQQVNLQIDKSVGSIYHYIQVIKKLSNLILKLIFC